MEVMSSSSKRQKCLHITSEQENEMVTSTTVHPLIPFQREEEEMAQIMKLNLVKEAAVEGQEENGGESMRKEGEGEDGDVAEKSVRHQSIEKLQKAQAELTQLVALTENVNTQAHLVLLTRTTGEAKALKGDNSTPLQRMCFVQKYFVDAEGPIQRERERMADLVKQRRAFTESLEHLRKVWRLKIHYSKGGSLVGRKSKHVSSSIGIDCSFGGADKDKLWVPLVMGGDSSPGYAVLPSTETDRHMFSLSLSLIFVPENVTIAHFTSWVTSQERALSWKDTPGYVPGASGDTFNEAIHNHCHKRQHESLSREIMSCLKVEASSEFDRWIITPKVVAPPLSSSSSKGKKVGTGTDTSTGTGTSTGSGSGELSLSEIRKIVESTRMSETLDVSFLNRGVVEIALSEDISLGVSLIRPPIDVDDDRDKTTDPLYDILKGAYMACASEYVSFLSRRGGQQGLEEKEEDGDDIASRNGATPTGLLRSLCDNVKNSLRSC